MRTHVLLTGIGPIADLVTALCLQLPQAQLQRLQPRLELLTGLTGLLACQGGGVAQQRLNIGQQDVDIVLQRGTVRGQGGSEVVHGVLPAG